MAIDNVTFVKAVSNAASQEFKDRIGTATAANIKKIGETVATYPTVKNEFVNVLTNQVSKQLFFNKVWENPSRCLIEANYLMVNLLKVFLLI